jgi:hypothetical protein
MRLYFSLVLTALLFSTQYSHGQKNESLVDVVREVFYDKRIYSRIFFDYHGVGIGHNDIQAGHDIFIFPIKYFKKNILTYWTSCLQVGELRESCS